MSTKRMKNRPNVSRVSYPVIVATAYLLVESFITRDLVPNEVGSEEDSRLPNAPTPQSASAASESPEAEEEDESSVKRSTSIEQEQEPAIKERISSVKKQSTDQQLSQSVDD